MQEGSEEVQEPEHKTPQESTLISSISKTEAHEDYKWLQNHFKDNERYISQLLLDLQSFLESQIEPPIPLFVNVYNLLQTKFLIGIGLGVFHTAIQILDYEYAFGQHQLDETGVYQIQAKSLSGATFYRSIYMGHIFKSKRDICKELLECAVQFKGKDYNLLRNNCNDFTNEICKRLVGQGLPKWVNRIAKVGGVFMKNMNTGKLTNVVAYQTDDQNNEEEKEQKSAEKSKQSTSNKQQTQQKRGRGGVE